MAKFPGIPVENSGYWCNPKQCKKCNEWFDFCMCNNDCAEKDLCEDCVQCGKECCYSCSAKGIVKKNG